MIVISACLAGCNCRYDGTNALNKGVVELLRRGQAVPVCPEQLGGLPTPRPKSMVVHGGGQDVLEGRAQVITQDGEDVTQRFLRGAKEALSLAKRIGAKKAILKHGSPSCNPGGGGKNALFQEPGVFAALLVRSGIEIEGI